MSLAVFIDSTLCFIILKTTYNFNSNLAEFLLLVLGTLTFFVIYYLLTKCLKINKFKISQKIKALYPRANTTFRGKNLKIIKIKVLSSDEIKNEKYISISNYSKPGIILAVIENEGIIISTKTDPIILLEA